MSAFCTKLIHVVLESSFHGFIGFPKKLLEKLTFVQKRMASNANSKLVDIGANLTGNVLEQESCLFR